MGKTFIAYTEEEEKELKKVIESGAANRMFFTQSMGASLMDTVGRQGNTLQNIERILQRIENKLCCEEQGKYFESAVSHALCGGKPDSSTDGNGEYIKEAVQSATRDIFR